MLPVVKFCYNYKNQEPVCNLGDYIQTIALEAFYKRFFPDAEQIVLDRDELAHYQGRRALVLMQGWFSVAGNLDFLPSPDLVPVFSGVHFSSTLRKRLLAADQLNRFREMEIGCRDYSTMYFLRAAGQKAYLSRCLTLTLPKRKENDGERNKIFWVDLPRSLEAFLPAAFHENAERISQREIPFIPGRESDNKSRAAALLEQYRREARCVVTAAIHCAMPCAAMGIPVLFINYHDRNAVIERWSAMHGIIPVYSEADLQEGRIPLDIPAEPDFEDLKENILQNAYLSCCKAMGNEPEPEKLANARNFIAGYNRTGAPSYEMIRTLDDMNTIEELDRTRTVLHHVETSGSYRIGRFLTWLPRKIAGGIRNLRERGLRYTVMLFFRKLGFPCGN